MWFGRIVPLLRFPLIKTGLSNHNDREDRLLPLPVELCVGMNTDEGTALYVTYGVNPDLQYNRCRPTTGTQDHLWGDDLAGWLAIAPFPPTLLSSPQLMRLGVDVKNEASAFRNGVTGPIAKHGGTYLAMEILGCGDMGSLVLLPHDQPESIVKESVRAEDSTRAVHEERWRKTEGKGGDRRDWISNLFSRAEKKPEQFSPIKWADDRRVLIRESQITVPYGDFWAEVNRLQKKDPPTLEDRITPADYCFLARDMELPVLLALFPSRPLFKLEVNVIDSQRPDKIKSKDRQIGSGMLNSIIGQLSSRKINMWHTKITYRSLNFYRESTQGQHSLKGVDAEVSIIASVPRERKYDTPDAMSSYLKELREDFFHLGRALPDDPPPTGDVKIDKAFVEGIFTQITDLVQAKLENSDNPVGASRKRDGAKIVDEALHTFNAIVDKRLEEMAKAVRGEPDFVKEVDIHGPPLFRCFFSHSAQPDYDERDYIDRLKRLLQSEVFEVIEGEFSLGMSTEELSRDKIRRCNLFVSFLWPRKDFHKDTGEYMPPEWVIHEESFAIGQNLPVYRVREKSVAPPRYQQDRLQFEFLKGDILDWENLEQKFRQEIRQLALRILLHSHTSGPRK